MVKEFTDKQEYYLPQLAEMLKPYQSLDEKQVKALYATYRNAVIADLVPPILDQVEADLRKRLAGDLASLPAKEAAVSAPEPTPTEVKATATPLTKAVTAPEITESETPTSLSTEDYMSPAEHLLSNQQSLDEMTTSVGRIWDVMDYPQDILLEERHMESDEVLHRLSGDIDVSNLEFGYSKMLPPVISGLDLHITHASTLQPGSVSNRRGIPSLPVLWEKMNEKKPTGNAWTLSSICMVSTPSMAGYLA